MKCAADRPLFRGGFTLVEVMIASAILALGLMGVLLITSSGVRGSRTLSRIHVDASEIAAELSLTNRLEEGSDSGDFGDFHPGYQWRREITQVETNGLFQVDFFVWSAVDPRATESKMTILLFRPDSPQRGLGR